MFISTPGLHRRTRRRNAGTSWRNPVKRVTTAPFVDEESDSLWDITGRAVADELKGRALICIDSTRVKCFASAAEYPETTIYAQK